MANRLPKDINWSWNSSSDPSPAPTPDTAMQTDPPVTAIQTGLSSSAMQTEFPTTMPFRPRPTNIFTDIRATPVNLTDYLASTPSTPTASPANPPTTPARTTTATHRYPLRSRGPPSPVPRAPRNRRARRAKFNAEMNDFVAKVIDERRMEKLMKGVGGLGVGASGGEASTDVATLRTRDMDEERAWVETAKMTFRVQWGGVRRRPEGQFAPGQSRNARRRRRAEERMRREAEGEGNGSPVPNDEGDARPRLLREEAMVGLSTADTGMEMEVEGKKDAVVEGGDEGMAPLVGMLTYGGIILSTDGRGLEVVQSGDEWTNRSIMDID